MDRCRLTNLGVRVHCRLRLTSPTLLFHQTATLSSGTTEEPDGVSLDPDENPDCAERHTRTLTVSGRELESKESTGYSFCEDGSDEKSHTHSESLRFFLV